MTRFWSVPKARERRRFSRPRLSRGCYLQNGQQHPDAAAVVAAAAVVVNIPSASATSAAILPFIDRLLDTRDTPSHPVALSLSVEVRLKVKAAIFLDPLVDLKVFN